MSVHLVFVLQRRGLQLVVVVSFKGDEEPAADAVVAALHLGEGKLPVDDAFLDAAQRFGPEVDLHFTKVHHLSVITGCFFTQK